MKAYHGGSFFKAIGEDFQLLENRHDVISADVLDAWFDPSPMVIQKVKDNLEFFLRTSPPTHCDGLIQVISETRAVPVEQLVVGGGSSDIMFYLFPNFLKSGAGVMILDPMYGEYAHIFNHVADVRLSRFPLDKKEGFRVNINALLKRINEEKPDLLVLVNPNSPTGVYLDQDNVLQILNQLPAKTKLLLDETYIEYMGRGFSLEYAVKDFPQLMIIKSMSKVYGLSGARVAYLVANPDVVERISRFIPPWAVSLPAQVAAVEAMKDETYYIPLYDKTHQMCEAMRLGLKDISAIKIYPSVANFFLLELISERVQAEEICEQLKRKKIFIRNCDSMSAQFQNNFLRIAVKTEPENQKIIKELRTVLGKY